jgi:helicase
MPDDRDPTSPKYRGLFVGIDRYASPSISWLSCAERDATALQALFADTFGDGGELLIGGEATRTAIVARLEELTSCSEDDFVVIAFSGHGSETHELVTYDASVLDLKATALPLDELADVFARIPARRLVCVLDCCFSGGLGAKVLRVDAKPKSLKSADALLNELAGDGRLIVTASSATEEAWENGQVGHGLLTYYLLEALQGAEEVRRAGKVAVLRLFEYVTDRVADAARALGTVQTATLRGTIDGAFTWPVLTAGATYYDAFPERARPMATSDVASLAAWGFQSELLDAWAAAIPGLNQLQLDAINEFGVLEGAHLVVSAPTSSGKTMVGELAALNGVAGHRRALFLLPLKALVNDKYHEFERKYGGFGTRTIRATGEFNDDVPDLLRGHYDISLMTYEKATALLLAHPHLLRQVGTIVIDEGQMIVDPSRGVNLEFLLTLLKARRREGVEPQLIALSAVIGDTNGLERWMDARLLRRDERPVPLREGILTRSGEFRFVAPDGSEQREHLIQPRYMKGTSQDWVIPLVQKLVEAGKKVLIFRETKGETTGCAGYLAQALRLAEATEALAELPTGDPSNASANLRGVLSAGVAFHNADLDRDEKLVIERHFRDPDSPLRVVVATTTLAMGVNTPASAVIVVGLEHPGDQPYSVAEYKNMIGRAGRLGFNEEGESYLIAPLPALEQQLWQRYIRGVPEDLQSQLLGSETDVRSLILRVLATAGTSGLKASEIVSFLEDSFGAFQQKARTPEWSWNENEILAGLADLAIHELVATDVGGRYQPTDLGRLAGETGTEVESIVRLVAAIRPLAPTSITDPALVTATQLTVELDELYFPINKRSKNKEPATWTRYLARFVPRGLFNALGLRARDRLTAILRAKKASACLLWMSAEPRSQIERVVLQHGGGFTAAGPIQSVASRTCDLLPVVARTAEILHPELDLEERTEGLMVCLELGLPADLAELGRAVGRSLARGDYLRLRAAGLGTVAAVADADSATLEQALGRASGVSPLHDAIRRHQEREEERRQLRALLETEAA